MGEFFDKERLYNEIIYPITQGRDTLSYRRYDCRTGSFTPMEKSVRKKLVVVEGVYSAHPFFGDYYDIGVFLRTDPETQSSRILARNGEAMHNRFLTEWIPRENAYFSAFAIEEKLSRKGFVFNT